jgi:hypothetical protein
MHLAQCKNQCMGLVYIIMRLPSESIKSEECHCQLQGDSDVCHYEIISDTSYLWPLLEMPHTVNTITT